MFYDQAFTHMTGHLRYGPVSARGLLHLARVRGSCTDAGVTITCTRHADDASRDRFWFALAS